MREAVTHISKGYISDPLFPGTRCLKGDFNERILKSWQAGQKVIVFVLLLDKLSLRQNLLCIQKLIETVFLCRW